MLSTKIISSAANTVSKRRSRCHSIHAISGSATTIFSHTTYIMVSRFKLFAWLKLVFVCWFSVWAQSHVKPEYRDYGYKYGHLVWRHYPTLHNHNGHWVCFARFVVVPDEGYKYKDCNGWKL